MAKIAIMPLAMPHFWHKNYGKVSIAWAVAFLVPFTALYGFDLALYEFLHVMLLDYVLPDDIKEVAPHILGHRLIIQPESRLRKITAPEVIRQILHQVDVPVMPEKRI